MKKRTITASALWLVGVVACCISKLADAGILYSFVSIDGAPNPGQNGGEKTFVQAISDTNLIVGFAYPDDPCTYSFSYDGVTFTAISVPASVAASGGLCVRAMGVNNEGEIVGTYGDFAIQGLGFLVNGGTFATIAVNNVVQSSPYTFPFTSPQAISNTGLIAGYDQTATGYHGFVLKNGAFSFFDVAGALDTLPQGINDFAEVVGAYSADGTVVHGFLKTFWNVQTIDIPGAADTYANSINDFGTIVGTYVDNTVVADCPVPAPTYAASGECHGFIYDYAGLAVFDFPGGSNTQLTGINNRGQIVGSYASSAPPNKPNRGFIASPISLMEVMPDGFFGPIQLTRPLITVVIRSTPSFNAPTGVNTSTLTFGHTGTEQSLAGCQVAHADLICTFATGASAFQCGDTIAVLQGQLIGGTPIRASDRVTIAPC